jgi:hypothetical protein
MATYLCQTDLFLPGAIFADAGSFLSDAIPTPAGMLPIPTSYIPPAQAVSPSDADALAKVFAAGPHLDSVEGWRALGPWNYASSRFTGMSGYHPSTYWYQLSGSQGWALKGNEGLGSKTPA